MRIATLPAPSLNSVPGEKSPMIFSGRNARNIRAMPVCRHDSYSRAWQLRHTSEPAYPLRIASDGFERELASSGGRLRICGFGRLLMKSSNEALLAGETDFPEPAAS